MEEERNPEEQADFVKSDDEFDGEEVDFIPGAAEIPKANVNFGLMSDSLSTLSSTAISRTCTPDESSYTLGVQPADQEIDNDPDKVKKDIASRGIIRPKMEIAGDSQLRSALVTAAVSKDNNAAIESEENNNESTIVENDNETNLENTNETAEVKKSSAASRPTILSFKRESDLTETRPSSASSSTTIDAPVEEEKHLKREVSFHNPETLNELVQIGEREASFISRPGNPPVELSTTCTQTEWSWLKDMELYQEISSSKPDWVRERKGSCRESKSSAGSSKSSIKKRRKKKSSKQPSSPLVRDKSFSEELKHVREEKREAQYKEGSDVNSDLSSPSGHARARHSLESPLPSVSKDDDMLFRPATVELSSSGDSDVDYDYFMDEESLIPSIGPPAILQYIKESQHPPLTNEEVEDRESLAKSEFLKKSMFSGPCMFCKEEVLPFPTIEELEELPAEQLFCCPQYERFIKFELSQRGDKSHVRDELIDIKPHPPYGTKAARRAAKERAAERAREREMERQKAAGINPTNFYALTRQMKTINYSLASTKCMEEGWTVKPRSPSPSIDGQGDDQFVIEVNPIQLQRRAFLERFYEDGSRFLLLLPDGTGSCYYPSGNVAVMITSTERGKFTYLVYEDNDDFEKNHSGMLASFDPSGHGACYFRNGAVRLVLDPFGGVLLDSSGTRKKKWLWHNIKTHVHAPPFQPITFSITKQLAIRCLTQNKVVITYNHGKHTARFNVGSKLKAVRNLKTPVERDDHEMHLAEVKQFINILLDRTQNALRLPNYPRLDRLPLPLRLQKGKDAMRKGKLRPIRPDSQADTTTTVTVN